MNHRLLLAFLICFTAQNAFCQYSVSGRILEEKTKNPIEYASVVIDGNELWSITNEKGEFLLKNVPKGDIRLVVSCLGYARRVFEVKVSEHVSDLMFYLPEDNLALQEVVVTAKSKANEMSTSYVIDRAGIDHLQMSGAADVTSLLPGGRSSRDLNLAMGAQTIALRSEGGTEYGNPSFGTAVVVDGVRLSNNASVGVNLTSLSNTTRLAGIDSRNIAVSNIESVEVITGIPSVEHGDLTNGVFKINTRQGKSPYIVDMKTEPHTKMFSLSKGFGLGRNAGILNVNAEWTKAIADPASPYTSYNRNGLSLLYNNTFNKKNRPINLTFGISGNIGGQDTKGDPDAFTENFTKTNDNTVRVHTKLDYLPNLPWITKVEIGGSVRYSDKTRTQKTNRSSSSSTTILHGREEGYFVAQVYDEYPDAPIILIPPGYWYYTSFLEDKVLDITGSVKARWIKQTGPLRNNVLLGADFSRTGNFGMGMYYDDLRYAPEWREYRYDELPFMNNLAAFLEDEIDLKIRKSVLRVMAGVRSDMTMITGSNYGNVSSLSPRFNAKYIFPENKGGWMERLTLRAGYGKSVKLPSFPLLFPPPDYANKQCFAASVSGNENFTAYYIQPRYPKFNPDLKWAYSTQKEVGVDAKIKGVSLSISLFDSQTFNSYEALRNYEPYFYNFTNVRALDGCPIPSENRRFAIDQTTGIVTVSDKTGQLPSMELDYISRHAFQSVTGPINGSPSRRRGIEWEANFGKIRALQTTVRWDGNYYYYRGLDEKITPYMPSTAQTMADGTPYKYLGFMVGSTSSVSNGSINKQLRTNLTLTTHIPAIRFIVSLRIESSLYNYTQRLSEYMGQPYGFVLDDREKTFPSEILTDIYAGNQTVAAYPLYYVSLDDMNTQIPFAQALRDAYDNDRALYNELVKMLLRSNTDYFMNANKISAYASANINITKEIGDKISISFFARNFLNTQQLVTLSERGSKTSLFTAYVPKFYYGLSLKLKL